MKKCTLAILIACSLPLGSFADNSKALWNLATRLVIQQQGATLDNRLKRLWANEPVPPQVVGLTQGAYIKGYGMVFMSEMNLAVVSGITPFHPEVTADEVKRTREMKLKRVAQLRETMRDLLVESAATLNSVVGLDEQVVLSISLFYWNWEKHDGLPSQIVMHASKKSLVLAKTSATDKASIAVDEF
jgi:hypothetical protein